MSKEVTYRPSLRNPRYLIGSDGTVIGARGKPMRGGDARGYRTVLMYFSDGTRQSIAVHVLVCETFHGPRPSPKHHASHRDGNKRNNDADNLRWLTASENIADKIIHGTMANGARNGRAKLTADQVHSLRRESKNTTQAELARRYGISHAAVSFIITRRTWKHLEGES